MEGLIYAPKADGSGYEFIPDKGYKFTKADDDGLAVEKTVEVWGDKFPLTKKSVRELAAKLKTDFKDDEGIKKELFKKCKKNCR